MIPGGELMAEALDIAIPERGGPLLHIWALITLDKDAHEYINAPGLCTGLNVSAPDTV